MRESACASGFPSIVAQLPSVNAHFDGVGVCALVDSGCSRSIVSSRVVRGSQVVPVCVPVQMMNGESATCRGSIVGDIVVSGASVAVDCLVSDVVPGFDLLLGMDVIRALGGCVIDDAGVCFRGIKAACAAVKSVGVEDPDFSAVFADGKWVVKWNWNEEEPVLANTVANFRIKPEADAEFNAEVEEWISQGWLMPYYGEYDGLIPLMAVVQRNKSKVRPVMDYREVNTYITSHTGDSSVCGETLRRWRQMGDNIKLIDLRKAYLQIHVHPDLWKFQVVSFKGKVYCLTRLGFGLNIAPRIMTKILNCVLGMDSKVKLGTDSYIDDIAVNEDMVPAEQVMSVLTEYGLDAKPPEQLLGSRVLGLRVMQDNGVVKWRRDNVIDDVESVRTRRQLFSWCGQLAGHYPVVGWLRPACSYLKRAANDSEWDEPITDVVLSMVADVDASVRERDPVGGVWAVCDDKSGTVWCDASSLAVGVVLEIGGSCVEDGCWLRKADDTAHINLAELESVVRGVNLAMTWGVQNLLVCTDSATVYGWMQSMITGERRIKTYGLGAVLARRRLSLIGEVVKEYAAILTVQLVKSAANKADALTRVPKKWLAKRSSEQCFVAHDAADGMYDVHSCIKSVHRVHHLGVDRTHFLASKRWPHLKVQRRDVEEVVSQCPRCQSIDPAPVRWVSGHLDVPTVWDRIAADVTHYNGQRYLTVIDCGPSRFTIWKHVKTESADELSTLMEDVFRDHGPPIDILLDNATTFHSMKFREMCIKWGVSVTYRCAYRPAGNGIVERIHRTIKRMAARSQANVLDMVFYYNSSPKAALEESSVPANQVFQYARRCPGEQPSTTKASGASKYRVGDKVFVKPGHARCTTEWPIGVVTGVCGNIKAEVNGIPRHVGDLRMVPRGESACNDECQRPICHAIDAEVQLSGRREVSAAGSDSDGTVPATEDEDVLVRRNPRRQRRLPRHLDQFVTGNDDVGYNE